jgi:hypothetical protein
MSGAMARGETMENTYTNDVADVAALLASHIKAVSFSMNVAQGHGFERSSDGANEKFAHSVVFPVISYLPKICPACDVLVRKILSISSH